MSQGRWLPRGHAGAVDIHLAVPVHVSTLVGRGPDNDVIIDLPVVSSRHARLSWESEAGFRIHDLGSGNGTWLWVPTARNQTWGWGAWVRVPSLYGPGYVPWPGGLTGGWGAYVRFGRRRTGFMVRVQPPLEVFHSAGA